MCVCKKQCWYRLSPKYLSPYHPSKNLQTSDFQNPRLEFSCKDFGINSGKSAVGSGFLEKFTLGWSKGPPMGKFFKTTNEDFPLFFRVN